MAREVEIKIIDGNNSVLGSLDLTSFADFPLTFTKGISDINDLNARSGTYSLNFKIPATKKNNNLFDFVNNINTKNKTAILKRRSCVVFVDGIQLESGHIKVTDSDSEGFYKAVFLGDNTDWVSLMSKINLNELDWRDSVASFTAAAITAINNSSVATNDIIYPYIDRNSDSAVTSFLPTLYAKALIDKSFEKTGYIVDSNFFNTPEFKKLAVDFVANLTFDQDAVLATETNYSTTIVNQALTPPNWDASTMVGNLGTPAAPNIRNRWRFPNIFNNQIKDVSGVFSNTTNEYTVPITALYKVEFAINYEWRAFDTNNPNWFLWTSTNTSGGLFAVRPPNFKWLIVANNTSDTVINGVVLYDSSAPPNPFPVQTSLTGGNAPEVLLTAGDNVSIILELIDDAKGFAPVYGLTGPGSLNRWSVRILNNSNVSFIRKGSVSLGDDYALNTVIPQNVSCLNVIQDFKTFFNLYFVADTYRKIVKIEPRDDFFLDISNAIDWTDKLDLTNGFKISYATEYKETLEFKYQPDSNDKYLERWNILNSRTYGKYDQDLGTRFAKGSSVIQTNLFSPVVQGTTSSKMFTSIIRKEYGDLNINGTQNNEYNFRLFNTLTEQQFDNAGNPMRSSSPTVVTVGLSESFGSSIVPMNLNFAGADGLVQKYYSKTISNLLEGGVLSVRVNLSLTDYRDINLRKPVYIDAPTEIKGHYLIQKISKFQATKDQSTLVELLRFQSYVAVPNDPSQAGNIPNTISDPQGPNDTPDPIYIEETINGVNYLIPVYSDSNGNIVPVYQS